MSEAEEIRDANRRAFATQAERFERPGYIFTDDEIFEWIAASLPPLDGKHVLDVAGGTGALGRYLSRKALLGVILDLTPEMLDRGAAAGEEAGQRNVIFALGDAAEIPLRDDQFEVVVCRFALHHMADPTRVVAEMARVCAPGGTVAVIDLVADDGQAGERHNEIERLRDPSHTHALSESELRETMSAAGLELSAESWREQAMQAERWTEQAKPDAEAAHDIHQALHGELGGGEPTGLRPAHSEDGALTVSQRWLLLAGTPAAG